MEATDLHVQLPTKQVAQIDELRVPSTLRRNSTGVSKDKLRSFLKASLLMVFRKLLKLKDSKTCLSGGRLVTRIERKDG